MKKSELRNIIKEELIREDNIKFNSQSPREVDYLDVEYNKAFIKLQTEVQKETQKYFNAIESLRKNYPYKAGIKDDKNNANLRMQEKLSNLLVATNRLRNSFI